MNLLKIGERYINLDNVIGFDARSPTVYVVFVESAAGNTVAAGLASFAGEEGAALKRWIAANAEDVSEADAGSTGAPLGEPPDYTSLR